MGSIFCLMGKSSSGKDTIYKELLASSLPLERIIPCTTRPIRQGETHGVEYFFYTEEEHKIYLSLNKVSLAQYEKLCLRPLKIRRKISTF